MTGKKAVDSFEPGRHQIVSISLSVYGDGFDSHRPLQITA